MSLLSLVLLGAFFLNLPLESGLGIEEIWLEREDKILKSALQCALLFVSVFLQFIIFSYILSPLNISHYKYFLLFPLSAFLSYLFEKLYKRFLGAYYEADTSVFNFSYKSGLSAAAVIIILNISNSFSEAFFANLGLCGGTFLSALVLKSVRLRVINEKNIMIFRGIPLYLISMGLLSLVWFAAVGIYLSSRGRF